MKRTLVTGACLLLLTGCAAFPFHGSREVAGVRTVDALNFRDGIPPVRPGFPS